MKHTISHDLGQEKAKLVAQKAFETYRVKFEQYSPTARWTRDDTCEIGFKAKGIALKGTIVVKASSMDVELDVPFLLKPFQGKAIGIINDTVQEWIAKAKAGEV